MKDWEDYYQILGVGPEASEKEIKRAYREKAFILHPDRLAGSPESVRRRAEEELKKLNQAHDVLKDTQKRREYHSEWLRRKRAYTAPKPKPVVDHKYIRFDEVELGEIQASFFIIRNVGGPYKKIWIGNPDSWVRVVHWSSLTPDDELPLRVEIEAEGKDWDKSYSEYITVKLDEEETNVRIELQTKSEPLGKRVWVGDIHKAKPTPPSSTVSLKRKMSAWEKWMLGFVILVFVLALLSSWPSSTSTVPSVQTTPSPTTTQTGQVTTLTTPTPKSITLKHRYYLSPKNEIDPQIEANLGKWIDENLGIKMRWISFREGEWLYSRGYLDIQDYIAIEKHLWVVGDGHMGIGFIFHSPDSGKSWELQWNEPYKPLGASYPFIVYFSNETEGWVGSKSNLLYTQDGGRNWEGRPIDGEGFYICKYWFYNNHRIVVDYAYGNEYESFNGGKTWQEK